MAMHAALRIGADGVSVEHPFNGRADGSDTPAGTVQEREVDRNVDIVGGRGVPACYHYFAGRAWDGNEFLGCRAADRLTDDGFPRESLRTLCASRPLRTCWALRAASVAAETLRSFGTSQTSRTLEAGFALRSGLARRALVSGYRPVGPMGPASPATP